MDDKTQVHRGQLVLQGHPSPSWQHWNEDQGLPVTALPYPPSLICLLWICQKHRRVSRTLGRRRYQILVQVGPPPCRTILGQILPPAGPWPIFRVRQNVFHVCCFWPGSLQLGALSPSAPPLSNIVVTCSF